MVEINKYTKFLYQKKAELASLREKKAKLLDSISSNISLLSSSIEARDLVSEVGILAQKEIKGVIEELVTQALQAIFGKEYSFVLEDVINRNKPETNFFVCISGRKHSIRGELGGGVVDLIAFVLRIILWAISTPRSADILIFDEPMKFIDKEHLVLAGEMVKRLSETLKVQILIVSHEEQIISAADTSYFVEKVDGVSKVEKVYG